MSYIFLDESGDLGFDFSKKNLSGFNAPREEPSISVADVPALIPTIFRGPVLGNK
jgi:hypothetical protein